MSVPRWASALLRRLAPSPGAEDVLGDLEEAHRARVQRRGRYVASILTGLEALDMARALIVERVRSRRAGGELAQSGRGMARSRRTRLGVSWLDFKLSFRMLVKYPGLTLAGGLAIAFVIGMSAISFEVLTQVVAPRLPLDDGDRIVAVVTFDAASADEENRTLHDFAAWREEVASIEELGAFRTITSNLILEDGSGEPLEVAEISASAFRVARTRPLLGRVLVDADEEAGAPPVLVIGHAVWRTRFASDPEVVGKEVRLGDAVHTVVGVMPESFGFPIASVAWVPFKLRPFDYAQGEGPGIRVFGRLAPGATVEVAQSELAAIGARAAVDFPETHEHRRPHVMPYAHAAVSEVREEATYIFASANGLLVVLLFVICGNVALLMFARAATRDNEMLVRSALGASSRRIIAQLFVEALLLAGIAGAVGLGAANFGLRWMLGVLAGEGYADRLPFWFHFNLSVDTVLYATLLTILAATIAGVIPGLKVTRGLGIRLRQADPGGGGLRIDGLWTPLIVTQVALMAVVPVFLVVTNGESRKIRSMVDEVGFPTEEYLSVTIAMDRETAPGANSDASVTSFLARFGAKVQELERALEAESAVRGVTLADRLPLMSPPARRIEVDEGPAAPVDETFGYRRVTSASVAPDFFEVVDAPVLAGRGFHSGDLLPDASAVIVNKDFVDRILGGHNPIGRRLRYSETLDAPSAVDQPWHEIVGIVKNMGGGARVYHPLDRAGAYPVRMAVHVRGDPLLFVPRMRSIAMEVDPTLQLHGILRLDELIETDFDLRLSNMLFWITTGLTLVVLFLSLAGIYAVLSFTGSRRTREVGIRVALGGEPRRIAAVMFRRPMMQVGLGILAGVAIATWTLSTGLIFLVAYAFVILGTCSLAAIVPVRRALRIEPTEALKAEP